MSLRPARLNELLKREVSNILLREEGFDRDVLVTVTRAEVSPNLAEAKVFISVMPEERRGAIMDSLRKNIYHIQQAMNKKLRIKKIPRIVFLEEKKVKEAARIEELISKIHKNDMIIDE